MERYADQVLRWTRTTWRSNPRQLKYLKVWWRYAFTAFTLWLRMFMMSLTHEGLIILCLYLGLNKAGPVGYFGPYAGLLGAWVITTRCNKVAYYFVRYPEDLVWFPLYLVFG